MKNCQKAAIYFKKKKHVGIMQWVFYSYVVQVNTVPVILQIMICLLCISSSFPFHLSSFPWAVFLIRLTQVNTDTFEKETAGKIFWDVFPWAPFLAFRCPLRRGGFAPPVLTGSHCKCCWLPESFLFLCLL